MSEQDYWKTKWKDRILKPRNNFANRCFLKINKKHKSLLDIGCGDGKDSLFFAKKGLNVTSIDFSESGIKKLSEITKEKKLKNIKAIQKDITKLNFKNNSFDIIYAHLSLHYFKDKLTTKIFNKLYDILKPNGIIFIKCKSIDDALYNQGKKIEENMYKKNHIRHFFSKNYMKEKLNKFKIIKIRKTSSIYHSYKSAFIEAIAKKESLI